MDLFWLLLAAAYDKLDVDVEYEVNKFESLRVEDFELVTVEKFDVVQTLMTKMQLQKTKFKQKKNFKVQSYILGISGGLSFLIYLPTTPSRTKLR